MLRSFIYFFILVFLNSCTSKQLPQNTKDILDYKQNANIYTQNLQVILDKNLQVKLDKEFNKIYFKPWHTLSFENSIEDVTWQFKYAKEEVYGDNYKPLRKKWFEKQITNSNFERYNTLLKHAITIKNSNLRLFPTDSKIFYNPKLPGEGFPFDYNQNSGIKINSPLLVSHFSKDRAWVFVMSSFAKGWIKVSHMAFINKDLMSLFENDNYYVAIKEEFAVYKKGNFLEHIKLGTIFPKYKNKYMVIGRFDNGFGYLKLINIANIHIAKKPIGFNKTSVEKILTELKEEPYGWGELLNHRDCSALTKDYFAPFGINLQRNSYGQTLDYKYIEIKNLTNKEKKEFILKNAIPFLSLAHLNGHVMLYVGQENDEPIFFHNVWGVKTKDNFNNEGRFIIGKAIFSSLELGKKLPNYDEENSLLSRVLGIVNIF